MVGKYAQYGLRYGGLARAGLAYEAEYLAPVYGERYAVYRVDASSAGPVSDKPYKAGYWKTPGPSG